MSDTDPTDPFAALDDLFQAAGAVNATRPFHDHCAACYRVVKDALTEAAPKKPEN